MMIAKRIKTLPALSSGALLLSTLAFSGTATANTEFTVGGYLKVDALTTRTTGGSIPSGSIGRDFYIPGLTPVGGASNTYTDIHARESRFWFNASQTTATGDTIEGYVEFDFLGTASGDKRVTNSYAPRMRRAFIRYGNWLAGQEWSNFQDLAIIPEAPDFIGVADGTVFARQPQIRYTSGSWSFAVEQPETTVTPLQGGSQRITTGDTAMPDLTARYQNRINNVHYSVAGIVRRLEYRDEAAGISATENAYGINLTTRIDIGRHDIRAGLVSGTGLGRYVAVNLTNGAVVTPDLNLDTIDITAASVAYRHVWSDQISTNLMYSYANIERKEDLTGPSATRSTQRVAANLMYRIHPQLAVGGEISRATRELLSGAEGHLDRVQFSAIYNF
ncbi:MAG: porin [Idiomarina sp.]|nr:porin [Idiomarina sp.]